MKPLRILTTGSRHHRNSSVIALSISDWLKSQGTTIGGAYPIPILIHGGQRTWDPVLREWYGCDWLVGEIARTWGFTEERHPADWDRYGRGAGPIRNAHMAWLGADVCIAHPIGKSPGTRNCMVLADAAGIPVVVHEPATDAPRGVPN